MCIEFYIYIVYASKTATIVDLYDKSRQVSTIGWSEYSSRGISLCVQYTTALPFALILE